MDFPEKSFPYQLYKQEKKRNLFISCGSHDNIDIDDVVKKQFYAQKIPEGFGNKKTSLKSRRPALPLYKGPTSVQQPLTDIVTDPIIEENKEIVSLITNLKHNRGILKSKQIKRARNYLNYSSFLNLKNSLDELDSEEDVPDHVANTYLPKQFRYLVELHQKYKSITEIQKVNSRYADGCLGYLPTMSSESAGCLISPSEDFCEIKLSCLIYDEQEDVKVADIKSINTDDEMYGIAAGHSRDKGYLITRHASSCQMFSVGEDYNPVFIEKLEITDSQPTSQFMSPYIPNESLVATNKGSVYLWSAGNRKEEVVKQKSQRFNCRDQWRQAIFSSHPRQIVVADCTTVELFDLRKTQPSGIDLFALPSKFLHPKERIRIIKQHSPFVYVVATDHSLILTDERFPGHPWQHLLRYPPQFLSVLSDIGREKQSLITIASQNPMEAYCYMFQGGVHKEFQGTGSPWKLARPDDFTKWDEICNSTDVIAVEQWYNRDSLLGLQCVNYQDGFMAYQLDSHGDIYYQAYSPSSHNGDKTFAAGPGMNDLQLDDLTRQKGKDWVEAVNNALNESKCDRRDYVPISEIMQHFEEIILEKPSHLLCSLCHGMQDTEKGNNQDGMGDNSEADLCHCCRQNLSKGNVIADGASKDRVCSVSAQELESLPNVSTLPSDVLSQMVIRLWNDEEDVTDLLPLRDEEVKNKIEKRKENKKKKLETKMVDDCFPKEIRDLIEPHKKMVEKKVTSTMSSEEVLETDSSEVNFGKDIGDDGKPLSRDSSDIDKNSEDEKLDMHRHKRAKRSDNRPPRSFYKNHDKNKTSQRFSQRLTLSAEGTKSRELTPSTSIQTGQRCKRSSKNSRNSVITGDVETNLTPDTVKNTDLVTNIVSGDLTALDKVDTTSGKVNEKDISSNRLIVIEKNLTAYSGDLLSENFNGPGALGHNEPVSLVPKDLLKDLQIDRQRLRHSSLSSLSSVRTTFSVESALSGSLPGFMRTPPKKLKSPVKKQKDSMQESDISNIDLMDEEFLSPQSIQSVQMFTSVRSEQRSDNNDSPRKKMKVNSGSEIRPPLFSSPKKTKIRKHYVSGF